LSDLPVLWRTKLRSTRPDPPVVHREQVAHCLRNGLIGIGWGLDELPDGAPTQAVLAAIERKTDEGWGTRAARIVRRFAVDAKIGTLSGRATPAVDISSAGSPARTGTT
jgi:hypothetical protein